MQRVVTVDIEKCTGCRSCELACSLHNFGEFNPARARIHVVKTQKEAVTTTIPVLCRQCADPLCVKMCPVEALSRNEETGAIVVDKDRCLGCHTCVYVCPFGAPAVDPVTGVCEKCTLCDGDPHCVKVCAKEALTFGDLYEEGPHRKRAGLEKYLEHLETVTEA